MPKAYSEGFNTASGKYYCNTCDDLRRAKSLSIKVSIPQAVSTIAIAKGSIEDFTKSMVVSIPQAVSTIAIDEAHRSLIAEYAVFQYRKR